MSWGLGSWGGIDGTVTGPIVALVGPSPVVELEDGNSITVDVTSDAGGADALITADLNGAAPEVIYDGQFSPAWRAAETSRTAISGGYRYTFRRLAGWQGATTVYLRVYAWDAAGVHVTGSWEWTVAEALVAATTAGIAPAARLVADPFGVGILRPLSRNAGADFKAGTGISLVRSNLAQVIGTEPGEIRWRPSFGTPTSSLRHRNHTAAAAEVARVMFESSLARWAPQAVITDVTVDQIIEGGETHQVFSLAFSIAGSAVGGRALVMP